MNPTPEKAKPTLATSASGSEQPDERQLKSESSTACRCGWPEPKTCPLCTNPVVALHWGRL